MRQNPGQTVTIVICTRKRPVHLRKCLEAIAQLEPAANDVLVVDNSAGDKEAELISREFSTRYTVEPALGLSHARNRGLSESNSNIVAYLDDDALPSPQWLRFLLEPFSNPDVAVVTGKTVPPGSVNESSNEEPVRFLSNKDPLWFETAAFGGLGFGTNMALRKAMCSGWKVFDERLGRGATIEIAEESHAFATLLSRGYLAADAPAAIVVHPSKPGLLLQEASNAFAYWLLLYFESPGHRRDLLRFLFRRIRRQPLAWPRNSEVVGPIITGGWRVWIRASLAGAVLYLRTRKSEDSPRRE